jgi:hypothetical protein
MLKYCKQTKNIKVPLQLQSLKNSNVIDPSLNLQMLSISSLGVPLFFKCFIRLHYPTITGTGDNVTINISSLSKPKPAKWREEILPIEIPGVYPFNQCLRER